MELWDLYDKNRIPLGKTIERGKRLNPGEYHIVVHICVFSSEGKLLIQQRQPFKEGWANMWDISAGGSAIAGETSSSAAERELFEEIGIKHCFEDERPFFTIDSRFGFDDYYLFTKDVAAETLSLQAEEVQAVKWATVDEIKAMIDDGTFVPYHKSWVEFLFDSRKKRGTHTR